MSTPNATTPAEWLGLIADNAARLREAGVLRVRLGDCEVELAPHLPDAPREASIEEEPADPLMDPSTYGIDPRRMGARVPGFPRRRDEET